MTVGGQEREQGAADGWSLEDDGKHVTLRGRACIDFKALQPLAVVTGCR